MVKRMQFGLGTPVITGRTRPPLRLGFRPGRKLPYRNGSGFYLRGYMSEEVEALRRECDQGRAE